MIRALSVGTIFNALWESFEQIGTKVNVLHPKYPGAMTTDWLQDISNVYYGAGVALAAHKIKDKFKKKDLEEIL